MNDRTFDRWMNILSVLYFGFACTAAVLILAGITVMVWRGCS